MRSSVTLLALVLCSLALCSLVPASLAAQSSTSSRPRSDRAEIIAVVTARSYDALQQAASHLGAVLGKPGLAGMAEATIAQFTGGQPLDGVDTRSPLGVAFVAASDGDVQPLVFLRVRDKAKFEELFRTVAPRIQQAFGQLPYVPRGDMFFIGPGLALLGEKRIPEPVDLIGKRARTDDIAVVVHVDRIPPTLVSQAQGSLAMLAAMTPAARGALNDSQVGFEKLLSETKRVGFGLRIEKSMRKLVFVIDYVPQRSSETGRLIASMSRRTSRLARLVDPSAMASLMVNSPLDQSGRQRLLAMLPSPTRGMPLEGAFGSTTSGGGSIENRFIDCVRRTIVDGRIEFAVAVKGNPPGPMSVVGALSLSGAETLEDGLSVLMLGSRARAAKSPATRFSGLSIHEVTVPSETSELTRLFGRGPKFCWATAKDTLYFAFGPRGLPDVKWAIEKATSTRRNSREYSPLVFEARVKPWIKVLEAKQPSLARLGSIVSSMDRLRVHARPNSVGVETTIEVPESLLRLAGSQSVRPAPAGRQRSYR